MRANRSALFLALTLLSTSGHAVLPQTTSADLRAGMRIRFRAPEVGVSRATTGTVDSVGADTLHVRELSDPPSLRPASRWDISLATITQLDTSLGRTSRAAHARKGALWALAAYGVVAAAYVIRERSTCHGPDCFGEGMAWVGLAAAVPCAAGIGGAIGYALPVEHWGRVDVRRAR